MSSSGSVERSPIVDGDELPDGYGTLFEQVSIADYDDTLIGTIKALPLGYLRAWITKQNCKGEYHKFREVTGSTVLVWDEQGRAWEYEGGTLEIIEDRLDLESEYGDE